MSETDCLINDGYTICPWCGYRDDDAWEYRAGQVYDCPECDEPYRVECDEITLYSTYKVVEP